MSEKTTQAVGAPLERQVRPSTLSASGICAATRSSGCAMRRCASTASRRPTASAQASAWRVGPAGESAVWPWGLTTEFSGADRRPLE
jgi:hypothetical protein